MTSCWVRLSRLLPTIYLRRQPDCHIDIANTVRVGLYARLRNTLQFSRSVFTPILSAEANTRTMALRPLAAQHLPCRQLTGPSIRPQWHVCRAAVIQAAYTPKEAVDTLQKLLKQSVLSNAKVQPRSYSDLLGERVGLIAKQDISANEVSTSRYILTIKVPRSHKAS